MTCSSGSCSSGELLFDYVNVRAGLGQLGIIGSVTILLIKAPRKISISKLFYRDIHAFIEDVQLYVNSERIDMIHAFLKPPKTMCLAKIIGEEALFSSSAEFQSAIKLGKSEGGLIFFLELSFYMSEDSFGDVIQLDVTSSFLSSSTRCI